MKTNEQPTICPCGSAKKYSDCCQHYHQGAKPDNALALMRSRYSAFVNKDFNYIMRTTHPQNISYQKDRHAWVNEILAFCQKTSFIKLEILNFTEDPQEAFVTFIAHIKQENQSIQLIERSRFIRVDTEWFYRDGEYFKSRDAALSYKNSKRISK